jgi:hypothetical protein
MQVHSAPQNDGFLVTVTVCIVSAIGFLHLFLFFAVEVLDCWHKLQHLL